MPNYTFPNQRVIKINREKATSDFLGIKNSNWQAAARNLTPHAMMLYFYLASNANNYELALSPTAIRQSIGMARSTYHDQFNILVDKGYLVQTGGNTFEFYEVPKVSAPPDSVNQNPSNEPKLENNPALDFEKTSSVPSVLQADTEIYNNKSSIDNSDKYYGGNDEVFIYTPKVKEVVIPPPVASGKKRPRTIEQPPKPPKFEF